MQRVLGCWAFSRREFGSVLFFHDQTYLSAGILPEPGQLVLSFVNETGLPAERTTAPDDAQRKRVTEQPELGDESLRKLMVGEMEVA